MYYLTKGSKTTRSAEVTKSFLEVIKKCSFFHREDHLVLHNAMAVLNNVHLGKITEEGVRLSTTQ